MKARQVLKPPAWTFTCGRIYLLHCPLILRGFSFLRLGPAERRGFSAEMGLKSRVLKIALKCLVAAGVPRGICPDESFRLSGVVPKSKSQVEKEGALRPDAAGPDALLHCLRAASTDPARELCTGNGREGKS